MAVRRGGKPVAPPTGDGYVKAPRAPSEGFTWGPPVGKQPTPQKPPSAEGAAVHETTLPNPPPPPQDVVSDAEAVQESTHPDPSEDEDEFITVRIHKAAFTKLVQETIAMSNTNKNNESAANTAAENANAAAADTSKATPKAEAKVEAAAAAAEPAAAATATAPAAAAAPKSNKWKKAGKVVGSVLVGAGLALLGVGAYQRYGGKSGS